MSRSIRYGRLHSLPTLQYATSLSPSLLLQCKSAVLEERSGETKEVGDADF